MKSKASGTARETWLLLMLGKLWLLGTARETPESGNAGKISLLGLRGKL